MLLGGCGRLGDFPEIFPAFWQNGEASQGPLCEHAARTWAVTGELQVVVESQPNGSITIGSNLVGPDEEIFRITGFLGQGAFGEVYRAIGGRSGVAVAVKLLPVSSLANDGSKIALLNEIRAALQVVHPNVVRVLHVNDGTESLVGPYLFMEYVSGGTLARILGDKFSRVLRYR